MATMPASARQALVSLTQTMFPHHGKGDPMDKHILQISNQLASSTPLQMALYFNVYFFPLWVSANYVSFALKWDELNYIYQILVLAMLVFMTILEVVRLYLGYLGNLQEQVPELAGSWLLTVLLQTPLTLLLLVIPNMFILPLDAIVNIVQFILLIVEVTAGLFALRLLSRQQVIRFQLQQFYDEAMQTQFNLEPVYT